MIPIYTSVKLEKSKLIEEIGHDRSISIDFCVHVCDAASLVGTECIIVAKNG